MTQSKDVPTWNIKGLCTECRELKTKVGDKIWAYAIKIMAMGGIFELQTKDPTLFAKFGEGLECETWGTFEHFNGKVRFKLDGMKGIG